MQKKKKNKEILVRPTAYDLRLGKKDTAAYKTNNKPKEYNTPRHIFHLRPGTMLTQPDPLS
jgi:hypothetical protein